MVIRRINFFCRKKRCICRTKNNEEHFSITKLFFSTFSLQHCVSKRWLLVAILKLAHIVSEKQKIASKQTQTDHKSWWNLFSSSAVCQTIFHIFTFFWRWAWSVGFLFALFLGRKENNEIFWLISSARCKTPQQSFVFAKLENTRASAFAAFTLNQHNLCMPSGAGWFLASRASRQPLVHTNAVAKYKQRQCQKYYV